MDPFPLSELEFFLGRHDRFFDEMERALDVRSPAMAYAQQGRRYLWREVADHPRYLAIIERMGFPAPAA